MKQQMKRILALVIALTLVAGAGTFTNTQKTKAETLAEVKSTSPNAADAFTSTDETVYVLAGPDGSVGKIIVSDKMKDENGNATTSQETLEAALPVDLAITYYLDGVQVTPDDLAGKSGDVTIRFDYTNNQYEMRDIVGKQEKIFVPFLMISALILDNAHFTDIAVTNGKVLNDGNRTVVVGYALPGLSESLALPDDLDVDVTIPDYVEITAKATNFKLGSSFTVAANNLFNEYDEDDPDALDKLFDDMNELTDAMDQLLDGTKQLSEGLDTLLTKTDDLVEGVDQLADGASQVASGANQVASGADQLKTGASSLASGANDVKTGANALAAGAGDLLSGANALSGGADELAAGLNQISGNSSQINAGATQVFNALLSTAKTQLEANGLTVSSLTISNYQGVLNGVIDSLDAEKVYQQALTQVTAAVEAQRGYITEQVTAVVKEQVTAQVTAAVKANVTAQVTEAVKEQVTAGVEAQRDVITAQVTEAVKANVTAAVTEAVKEQVTAQVILAATGMSVEDYNAAVEAGQIDEATQAQITAAITAQMESDEVKAMIASQVEAKMSSDEIRETISEKTEETIQDLISAKMASSEIQDTIAATVDAQMASDSVKELIASNIEAQMASEDVKNAIEENVEAQVQKAIADTMAGEEVQAKLAQAAEGAKAVISLKTSLDQYNAFYLGVKAYTNAVDSAAAGASKLSSGAKELKAGAASLSDGAKTLAAGTDALADGANTVAAGTSNLANGIDSLAAGASSLADGTKKLKDNMPALKDGVTQLRDGADELNEGLNKFNEEGIQKLADLVNNDVGGVAERLKAVAELGKNYKTFSGVTTDEDSEVKFIYRTDAIGE